MEDYRLNNRKDNYRKCKFSIMESRERYNLSLRKQNIEEIIFKRRIKSSNNDTEMTSSIEINPEDLDIDPSYKNYEIKDIISEIELINEMLNANNESFKKFAVYLLRGYFVKHEVNDKEEIDTLFNLFNQYNIIKTLCDMLLTSSDNSLIFEVYWVLINLPYTNVDRKIFQVEIFSQENLIDTYVRHLASEYQDVVENTLWFLNVVIQDSVKIRDTFISSKIFLEAMKILRRDMNSVNLIEYTIWLLSSLMKDKSTTPPEKKVLECLEACAGYLHVSETSILVQCMWAIYNISSHDESLPKIYEDIMNSGAIVKLLKINYSRFQMCLSPCLRILGNLCTGRFEIVDDLLKLNILDFFDLILTQNKLKTILREVLWAISNICAGSINQCMQVLESPVFEKVLEYLGDQDYKLKKEAVLIINYYSSSNCLNMTLKLVNRGILEKLCIILENDKDKSILLSCLIIVFDFMSTGEQLEGYESGNRITTLFQRCGGVNILETLQMHTDLEIHKISLAILDRFYETKEISI